MTTNEPETDERAVDEASSSQVAQGSEGSDPQETAGPGDKTPVDEASRFKDLWMRTAADFENYRKRSRKEMEDSRRSGREELLKELLAVFDNLERGIQSAQTASDVKAVADGLSMVQKQFLDTLARLNIRRVPSTGSPFDPSVHEAIQQVETDAHPPGTVIAEVQPGYISGDRLVRAAMVVVAKPKSSGDATLS